MKKTTLNTLVLLLLMLSATFISAQTPRNSFVPDNVKTVLEKIKSVGNSALKFPTDLLSDSEQQILQSYYQTSETSNTSFRAFGDVYVLDLFPGADGYGSFPLTGPFTINNIANVSGDIFASDFGPRGIIYAIDNVTAGLVGIDKDSGDVTNLATLTGASDGSGFTGLTWNPVNETMYVLGVNNGITTLYTLDIPTGVLTNIGDTGTALGIWIAIDNAGVIYMADIADDSLHILDGTTGVATLVGPLGVDINFAQEADIDTATNTLYMASYTGDGVSEILSVNVTTGATTSLGAVANAPELGIFAIDGEIDNNFVCDNAIAIGIGVVNSNGPSNSAGGASNICEAGATNSEWYLYTATNSGDLTISSDLASNISVDTRVSVYNDDCSALVCIGSDDNSGADSTSILVIPVVSGSTYLIEWDDANNSDAFDFELSLAIACPDPVNFTNDTFTDITATFSWDTVIGATNGYVLNIFNAGDDPEVDAPVYTETIPSGTLTATASPLVSETTYDVYLTADCDINGMSNAVSLSFTTDITPPPCGGVYVDTGGADGEYSNEESITTTITPDVAGEVVTVTFTYVDIEVSTGGLGPENGCWDFLTVYNGPDETFPVLAQTLCGQESSNGDLPSNLGSLLSVGMSFTSTDASGALTFVFTSDISVALTGWSADITCNPPPPCATPDAFTNSLTTDTEATYTWEEIANATNGYVFSVFSAGDDPTTATPVFTENVPFGTNTVTATGLDSVTLYDAYIVADCDADGLSSDDSDTFGTDASVICDGNYVDSGGITDVYTADETTATTIFPTVSGEGVTVTFTYVDIESASGDGSQEGCWDFLTVYNGPDETFPVLAQTLCGEESGEGDVPSVQESLLSVGMSFTSTDASGALTFVFTSDESVQLTGWLADITCATLSVDDVSLTQFTYYPNPTTGKLNISAKENIDSIQVFNILGQRVMNISPNATDVTLDFSDLSEGAYFLKSLINGSDTTFKIMKN